MKINLEFISFVKQPFNQKWFLKVAKKTFENVNLKNLNNKKIILSLAVVDSKEISRLNNELRAKNKATDVLSIGDYSDNKNIEKEEREDIFLGEIILGFDFIKESANIDNVKVDHELGYVFSHGILHLLGYKHGKKMFSIQEKVCQLLSL